MPITRFEDIEAWQIARELSRAIYGAVKGQKFSNSRNRCRRFYTVDIAMEIAIIEI